MYLVGVANPTLQELPLAIRSRSGVVVAVEEIEVPNVPLNTTGYLPHGFEGTDIGSSTNNTIAGADIRLFRVTVADDTATALSNATQALPRRQWLRLAPSIGSIRREIEARPSFFNYFDGVVIDWRYVADRTNSSLAAEAVWLAAHRVAVALDFSMSTNLFPGLRLVNDRGDLYAESMQAVSEALGKMSILGCRDAIFTLHGVSELPPANFSGDPTAQTRASTQQTLAALANSMPGVTLHLRRSLRNDQLAGGGWQPQLDYVRQIQAANALLAPALAYVAISGDGVSDMAGALTGSSILLLSAPWPSAIADGALLTTLSPSLRTDLDALVAAARAAGAALVFDASYASPAEELADVAMTSPPS